MPSAVSSSARGVTLLILIQLVSRASTFAANQSLLRHLTPSHLGIAAQLELYSLSVLFFARESLRVALQRAASSSPQAVVNVAYVAPLVGIPLALVLGQMWAAGGLPPVPYMGEAVALTGLASVVELYAEPCFAVVQQRMRYGVRALAETLATVAKCAVTYAGVVWYLQQTGETSVVPFAIGQLAYALVLLVVYFAAVVPMSWKEGFSLTLTRISSDDPEYTAGYFSISLSSLAADLYLQSGLKYMLTQGDSLLIAYLASLEDQGAYALASNYGGLIARIIFQPIEESSRNLFAKLCASEVRKASQPSIATARDAKLTSSDKKRARKQVQQQPTQSPEAKQVAPPSTRDIPQAASILARVLHLYALLALVSCSLGPYLAPRLLSLLAGKRWSSTAAGPVLASYTFYIPLLALNGVTEAFVAAVASNTELRRQSVGMGGFFAAFAVATYVFLRGLDMGAVGLVWANCVNMAGRILWGVWFIGNFFARNGSKFDFSATLPATGSVAAAVAAGAVLRVRKPMLHLFAEQAFNEIIWAGCVAAGLGLALAVFERRFLIDCYKMTGLQK